METDRDEKLKDICNTIVMERPEAVGIAYIELDCGCIHYSGVSFNGDPIGKMQTLSGPSDDGTEESPICLKCYREKTLNMVGIFRATRRQRHSMKLDSIIFGVRPAKITAVTWSLCRAIRHPVFMRVPFSKAD